MSGLRRKLVGAARVGKKLIINIDKKGLLVLGLEFAPFFKRVPHQMPISDLFSELINIVKLCRRSSKLFLPLVVLDTSLLNLLKCCHFLIKLLDHLTHFRFLIEVARICRFFS